VSADVLDALWHLALTLIQNLLYRLVLSYELVQEGVGS
jgi:hypothetical protein